MKVTVKWIVSPRAIGIPRAPGTFSSLDAKDAKKILDEFPGIFEYVETEEKEKPPKIRTRPVKRD